MPGYILHLAEAQMIIQNLENHGYYLCPEWKNRFQLGCLLPDTRKKREKVTSHFWNPKHMDRQAIAPDMERFLNKYEDCLYGPLMLGYRTHLLLDYLYVNEFWKRVLAFQDADGNPKEMASEIQYVFLKNTGERVEKKLFFSEEYFYGDYSRMNAPLRKKYGIMPPVYDQEMDCPVAEVKKEDLKQLLVELEGILQRENQAAEESLRVFRQDQLEDFLRQAAEEATEFIRNHLFLLALDLDGTLLRTDKSLSSRSRAALCKAVEEGHQVIISSGRPFGALPENVLHIPGVAYAIVSNGVSVYDLRKKKRIFYVPMDRAAAEAVLELAERMGGTPEILFEGEAYTTEDFVRNPMKYGVNEHGVSYIKSTRIPVPDIYAFARKHIGELDGIDLLTPDLQERAIYLEHLAEIPYLYLTSSLPRLIEISAEGAGKGKALKKLADYFGHDSQKMIAFGNEENDLDMFEAAGCSVAVGNSPDAVKNRADVITGSNDEDGVADFLEGLVLIRSNRSWNR